MQLPRGWVSLSGDAADKLEVELHRELPVSHQLHGWRLRAIARREHRDDVLFRAAAGDGLTWSTEGDPAWPWTVSYENLGDFCERWPLEEDDA